MKLLGSQRQGESLDPAERRPNFAYSERQGQVGWRLPELPS